MCPKQKQNANCSQVEIDNLIVRGRNLPSTNSTKCETQNIFGKKQQNEHTPGLRRFEYEKCSDILSCVIKLCQKIVGVFTNLTGADPKGGGGLGFQYHSQKIIFDFYIFR